MPIELDIAVSSFNLHSELSKINISIPFSELLRNNEYREKISKMVKTGGECQPDTLELTDDSSTIVLGPRIEETYEEDVPNFYVILNVHNMILHNAMLYSSASHNLIPRVVVESIGLEITRPYRELFYFVLEK